MCEDDLDNESEKEDAQPTGQPSEPMRLLPIPRWPTWEEEECVLDAIREGDKRADECLFVLYAGRLYRHARFVYAWNQHDAEDAVINCLFSFRDKVCDEKKPYKHKARIWVYLTIQLRNEFRKLYPTIKNPVKVWPNGLTELANIVTEYLSREIPFSAIPQPKGDKHSEDDKNFDPPDTKALDSIDRLEEALSPNCVEAIRRYFSDDLFGPGPTHLRLLKKFVLYDKLVQEDGEKTVTIRDLAIRYGKSVGTIHNWITTGLIHLTQLLEEECPEDISNIPRRNPHH